MPDAIFDPEDQGFPSKVNPVNPKPIASGVQLTKLRSAVLYQLNAMRADSNDPIEVEQTSDGHVRVLGVITDDDREQEILARLK